MVFSRGASDDARLDTSNQASPPRGDVKHTEHENAGTSERKLNFNSIVASTDSLSTTNNLGAPIAEIASTARNLPAMQLTNTNAISDFSSGSLLAGNFGGSNDTVRAADAFKNLINAASAKDGNFVATNNPFTVTEQSAAIAPQGSAAGSTEIANAPSPFTVAPQSVTIAAAATQLEIKNFQAVDAKVGHQSVASAALDALNVPPNAPLQHIVTPAGSSVIAKEVVVGGTKTKGVADAAPVVEQATTPVAPSPFTIAPPSAAITAAAAESTIKNFQAADAKSANSRVAVAALEALTTSTSVPLQTIVAPAATGGSAPETAAVGGNKTKIVVNAAQLNQQVSPDEPSPFTTAPQAIAIADKATETVTKKGPQPGGKVFDTSNAQIAGEAFNGAPNAPLQAITAPAIASGNIDVANAGNGKIKVTPDNLQIAQQTPVDATSASPFTVPTRTVAMTDAATEADTKITQKPDSKMPNIGNAQVASEAFTPALNAPLQIVATAVNASGNAEVANAGSGKIKVTLDNLQIAQQTPADATSASPFTVPTRTVAMTNAATEADTKITQKSDSKIPNTGYAQVASEAFTPAPNAPLQAITAPAIASGNIDVANAGNSKIKVTPDNLQIAQQTSADAPLASPFTVPSRTVAMTDAAIEADTKFTQKPDSKMPNISNAQVASEAFTPALNAPLQAITAPAIASGNIDVANASNGKIKVAQDNLQIAQQAPIDAPATFTVAAQSAVINDSGTVINPKISQRVDSNLSDPGNARVASEAFSPTPNAPLQAIIAPVVASGNIDVANAGSGKIKVVPDNLQIAQQAPADAPATFTIPMQSGAIVDRASELSTKQNLLPRNDVFSTSNARVASEAFSPAPNAPLQAITAPAIASGNIDVANAGSGKIKVTPDNLQIAQQTPADATSASPFTVPTRTVAMTDAAIEADTKFTQKPDSKMPNIGNAQVASEAFTPALNAPSQNVATAINASGNAEVAAIDSSKNKVAQQALADAPANFTTGTQSAAISDSAIDAAARKVQLAGNNVFDTGNARAASEVFNPANNAPAVIQPASKDSPFTAPAQSVAFATAATESATKIYQASTDTKSQSVSQPPELLALANLSSGSKVNSDNSSSATSTTVADNSLKNAVQSVDASKLSQVAAITPPADQANQTKSATNSADTSQFNGRYAGPGSVVASVDQAAAPIAVARRQGSGLARDTVEPGNPSSIDSKQFSALPGSTSQLKPFTIDGASTATTAGLAKDASAGKGIDTTNGTIAAESLKQFLGRQLQGEQGAAGIAADALKFIIAKQLTADLTGDHTNLRTNGTPAEFKALTPAQPAVGVGQLIASPGLVENRSVDVRAVSGLLPTEATSATNVLQPGVKTGFTADTSISQSITTVVGIGTIVSIGPDGKPTIIDGKTNLIDGKIPGTFGPLPTDITGTVKSVDSSVVFIGKDGKPIDLTDTTGATKKSDTTKLGDLLPGTLDPSLRLTNKGGKQGDSDDEDDDEEVIKNAGTMAGAGGFGGGSSDPDKDPSNTQNSTTVTGTIVDPDQKIVLPDLEIVDEHSSASGKKTIGDVATHVESESDIANAEPQSRQDDLIVVNTTPEQNVSNFSPEVSEIDRHFGITKNQRVDEQTATQLTQWQTEMMSVERRRTYKIKRGENLADIARRELGNVDFMQLLIEINIDTLTFDRYGMLLLRPGQEIYLPSRADMMRFVAYRQHQDKVLIAFADKNGIDTNTQIVYACRLGDTLASVAKRHPAIRDARLWRLIAELNDLSTKKDKNGSPAAKLQRGQHLLLPTSEQKNDYIHELAFGTKSKDLTNDFSRHIPRDDKASRAPQVPVEPITEDACDVHAEPQKTFTSRLVSQSDLGDTGDSLILRLELQVAGVFVPVVEYLIGFGSATLNVHTKNGESRATNIDLPNRSARELAESDLQANANKYCQNFESNLLPF